jgi:hypothetical protein
MNKNNHHKQLDKPYSLEKSFRREQKPITSAKVYDDCKGTECKGVNYELGNGLSRPSAPDKIKRKVVCVFGKFDKDSDFVLEPACKDECKLCKNAFWIEGDEQ